MFEDCREMDVCSGKYKTLSKARRMPRKIQKQRKEAVATAKTIAQGIMTIRTIMNTSPIIDFIQMTVKRMIPML